MSSRASSVLVAGGTGVLGARIVDRLVRAGHDVFATTRRPERTASIEACGATALLMDALVPADVTRAVETSRPDLIIHELTDLAEFDFGGNARLRVEGTANLVAAAHACGVDHMIAQSIAWAYEPGEGLADETVPLARAEDGSPAFGSVESLEEAVLSLGRGVVLRYGMLYGPGTWYSPEGGAFHRRAREGEVVATTAWTSFVHVEDATDATVAALTWPRGVVNVVDDAATHVDEWGPALVAVAGGVVSSISARAEGRAASNARARSLGWKPRHPSWRESWSQDYE
ncbi:NAD(P)-dependent oxidoreductase [Actinopolymorpha sp. B11F2]|uniref:NAD-dependent epimerase/dehydratase family protein n=1 Tax=Actinopolymorpha sp. B11F2 TaxID=3160862 RepID=UPI0032E3E688